MVENGEFGRGGVVRRQLNLWFGPEFIGDFEAGDESPHLGFCDLPQSVQVLELGFKTVVCAVEPVPPSAGTMYAEWPANGITKFVWPELILARKDLNPFGETGASLYRHLKAKRKIIDVDAAVSGKQRLVRKSTRVRAPPRLFP